MISHTPTEVGDGPFGAIVIETSFTNPVPAGTRPAVEVME